MGWCKTLKNMRKQPLVTAGRFNGGLSYGVLKYQRRNYTSDFPAPHFPRPTFCKNIELRIYIHSRLWATVVIVLVQQTTIKLDMLLHHYYYYQLLSFVLKSDQAIHMPLLLLSPVKKIAQHSSCIQACSYWVHAEVYIVIPLNSHFIPHGSNTHKFCYLLLPVPTVALLTSMFYTVPVHWFPAKEIRELIARFYQSQKLSPIHF